MLCQATAKALAKNTGCIINMIDIHADRPMKEHTVYCMAKASLAMMTKSLAKELAPNVRVNGIAPGAILWPQKNEGMSDKAKQSILNKIPLAKTGTVDDITHTVSFLITSPYITGQIIAVDGGRSLSI
jgi:pteridine reductase